MFWLGIRGYILARMVDLVAPGEYGCLVTSLMNSKYGPELRWGDNPESSFLVKHFLQLGYPLFTDPTVSINSTSARCQVFTYREGGSYLNCNKYYLPCIPLEWLKETDVNSLKFNNSSMKPSHRALFGKFNCRFSSVNWSVQVVLCYGSISVDCRC